MGGHFGRFPEEIDAADGYLLRMMRILELAGDFSADAEGGE